LTSDASKVAADLNEYGHHHPISPEMVQMLTVKQFYQVLETREYYRAMRDAFPTNCAWGNLEERYDRQIIELLRSMGAWFGIENQKEPLTSRGVRNLDISDLDIEYITRILHTDDPPEDDREPSRKP
jgi:hypothetical protein